MSNEATKPVEVTVSKAAVETNTMRIWLRRIPEYSGTIYAFRVGSNGVEGSYIAQASIYGRGVGSTATQRTMLLFRLNPGKKTTPIREGDIVRLQVKNLDEDGYKNIELDVLSVE